MNKDFKIDHNLKYILDGFTYAGIGSILKIIGAPLERVKLINQTNPKRFKGFYHCLTTLSEEEGLSSLWRGNNANSTRYFYSKFFGFYLYDYFQNNFSDKLSRNSKAYLSGGLTEAISLTLLYPLDFIRTRISTDLGKEKNKLYSGFVHAFDKIKKEEGGIRSIYKGYKISLFGGITYRSLYFGGYETLKSWMSKDELSIISKLFISQMNIIFSQTITYPIDTIRRAYMLSGKIGKDGKSTPIFKNSIECYNWIIKERGKKGLYKGYIANICKSPFASLFLVIYDILIQKKR